MSALTPKGSTRLWRRIRLVVLERDAWTCRCPCGCTGPATTAGHVVARHDGGTDALDNLAAECTVCNYGRHRDRPRSLDIGPPGHRRRVLPSPPGTPPFQNPYATTVSA